MQSQFGGIFKTQDFSGCSTSENILDKFSATKESLNKTKKRHFLFNINPTTIPSRGRYEVKELVGPIKRSLNLAPSTHLGAHHKEEIDVEIQRREYTKLGPDGKVQLPSYLNNINYHKSNLLKDYTYNNLTGAYYKDAPN